MLTLGVVDEPWREQAACSTLTNPDIMFPNLDRYDEVVRAKAVCAGCPLAVQRSCAIAAIEAEDKWSVSGGMTPKERKRWAGDRDS